MTREDVDRDLRALVASGEIDRATERTIRIYGPELIGWLCAMLARDADAYDAFSWLSEELWRSLPRYEGRCSVRAWCYMLARQAVSRAKAQPESREQPVSRVSSIEVAVDHVWSTTRREEVRIDDVYTEIRKTLDQEDEMLLILRVDRDLSWRDIALVLVGEGAPEDEVSRKAAALRKQFERVKVHLRELAATRLSE